MQRCLENPVVRPDMVKPTATGYRVRGAFNPGAIRFGDEILLLLRVAEDCPAADGEVAVPTVDIQDGHGTPGLLRLRKDDPDVCLKDTRGKVWEGMQSIVCHNCNEALLLIDENTSYVLTVDFDDEDHDDVS